MFVFFLLHRSKESTLDFNILPPLRATAPGEYNLWTTVGPANNMKNSLHLSSKRNRTSGAVCTRLPTTSLAWDSVLNVSVDSGTFSFLYTENICPFQMLESGMYFQGFAIQAEEKDETLEVSSTVVDTNYSIIKKPLCKIPSTNVVFNVSISNNFVDLKYMENNTFKSCGEQTAYQFLTVGFFTMASFPAKKIGSSDVYEFKVNLPKDHKEEYDSEVFEKIVRKTIHPKNMNRKPFTLADRIHNLLPDEENITNPFKYIDCLLGQMNKSLKNSLSQAELSSLIEEKIRKKLMVIEKKIEKRRNLLSDISMNLFVAKRNMTNDMNSLKEHVFLSMEQVKRQSTKELKKFLVKAAEAESLTNSTKHTANEISQMWVPTILYVVAFIELACYVGFFFHKKKVTDNFKKYD